MIALFCTYWVFVAGMSGLSCMFGRCAHRHQRRDSRSSQGQNIILSSITLRLDSFTLVCYHLVPTLHKFEAEWVSLLHTVRAIVSSCPVFQLRPAFVRVVGDYGDTPSTKDQHWLNSYSCCPKSPELPSVAPHVLASQQTHLQVAKWAQLNRHGTLVWSTQLLSGRLNMSYRTLLIWDTHNLNLPTLITN